MSALMHVHGSRYTLLHACSAGMHNSMTFQLLSQLACKNVHEGLPARNSAVPYRPAGPSA